MVEQRSPKPCVVGSNPTRPVLEIMIGKIKTFILEVLSEMKRVSWSSREEVIQSTKVVLISAVLLGVFISGCDFLLSKLLELLIQ